MSFNRSLWQATGARIGREARASMNAGNAYSTFWAPVINLAREPRWGRNLEWCVALLPATAGRRPSFAARSFAERSFGLCCSEQRAFACAVGGYTLQLHFSRADDRINPSLSPPRPPLSLALGKIRTTLANTQPVLCGGSKSHQTTQDICKPRPAASTMPQTAWSLAMLRGCIGTGITLMQTLACRTWWQVKLETRGVRCESAMSIWAVPPPPLTRQPSKVVH